NKLKEQIKEEQKAHEETKVKLKNESDKLTQKEKELDEIDLILKAQKNTYSAAIQPLKTVFKEDVRQRVKSAKEKVENVTS
uniref:hypothetical protein n=1 Tax=Italian clover phyllody phytoplasma TaxID=1196420 RepID=UPI00037D93E4